MKNILLDEAIQLTDEDGRTFEKDNAALKYYFNKFNQIYFGGVLDPIPLYWMNGSRLHGYFAHKTNFAEKKFVPICIKLNINASGTYAAFRNVFVHEMLHYYVDCYTQLPPENWERAIRCASYRDRNGVNRALRCTNETCHQFEWKRLADKLSAEYPELGNIERYAVKNNETGVALMDKDYIAQWSLKHVILRQESVDYGVKYYIISVNCQDWKELQESLKTGIASKWRFKGKWTRLYNTLEPENFHQKTVSRDLTRYYSKLPPEMIRREKELGTVR